MLVCFLEIVVIGLIGSWLVGRLGRNVVLTGSVMLNGKKRRLDYGVVVSYFPPFFPPLLVICTKMGFFF